MRLIRNPSDNTPRGHTKEAIERMIIARGLKVGDKLPTYRDMAAHFGIAVRTIERVMRQMADEGTVQLLHGKGAFVRKVPAGSGKLAEIGLVYPATRIHLVQTDYLNQILVGIIIACDLEQIDLQIVALRPARKASQPVPARDIVMRVDGVILLGMLNEPYIAEFTRESVPLVLADSQTAQPVHSLCADNASAVNQVMDHLYALGHRRIAYMDAFSADDLGGTSGPAWVGSPDTRERREAYLAAARRLDLDYQRIFPPIDDQPESLSSNVEALLRQRPAPSAILTYDDHIGRSLCEALSRAGLQVPRDISVACAAGTRSGTVAQGLLLTCAIVDFQKMGRRAVEALCRQAVGGHAHRRDLERIASRLQTGNSTAPVQPC